MDNLQYLFAGFAVFWAGLFVYILLLQFRLRSLQREVDRLEERLLEADTRRRTSRAPRPPHQPAASPRPATEEQSG